VQRMTNRLRSIVLAGLVPALTSLGACSDVPSPAAPESIAANLPHAKKSAWRSCWYTNYGTSSQTQLGCSDWNYDSPSWGTGWSGVSGGGQTVDHTACEGPACPAMPDVGNGGGDGGSNSGIGSVVTRTFYDPNYLPDELCDPRYDPRCVVRDLLDFELAAFRADLDRIRSKGSFCEQVASRGTQYLNEQKAGIFTGPLFNRAGEESVGDNHGGKIHISSRGFWNGTEYPPNILAQKAQIFRHEIKHGLGWTHAEMQLPERRCD
jgi:hypothetical protein